MINLTAKPEQTFALVVGIEKYQETAWNVGGTAIDAFKFAQWLKLRGVPQENIRLCLSCLDGHQNLCADGDLKIEEATEQNLFAIITDFLSSKSGDLLYIYWAGHGLINSERERRLLCADITQRNWQNIDLDSLLLFLNSDAFAIRRHICIVDACANYLLESNGRPTNLGGRVFSSGKPRTDSQQFVLLATREGEKAKVNSANKTGYFSQAVREALEQEPPEIWPPDMVRIAEKVKQQFPNLHTQQRPTYYFYQTWDGDKSIYHSHQFDISHNIPRSNARKFVGRDLELIKLHQLLQENDIVAITDLTGNGGVGKTELAIQYANKYLTEYSGGCCWLYPQNSDVRTQLINFAIIKNFTNSSVISILDELDTKIFHCWEKWHPGNVLLVFDNVKDTDIEQIQQCLPPSNYQCKVLITTRNGTLPYERIPLGKLQPEPALELLLKLWGEDLEEKEIELAKQLCEYVDYLPIALYQIATLRRKQGKT
jgi:hypothetical protein